MNYPPTFSKDEVESTDYVDITYRDHKDHYIKHVYAYPGQEPEMHPQDLIINKEYVTT